MTEYYARQKGLVRVKVTLSNGFSGVTFVAILTELKRGSMAKKVAMMDYLPLRKNIIWNYRWLINNKKTIFTCQKKVGKIVKKGSVDWFTVIASDGFGQSTEFHRKTDQGYVVTNGKRKILLFPKTLTVGQAFIEKGKGVTCTTTLEKVIPSLKISGKSYNNVLQIHKEMKSDSSRAIKRWDIYLAPSTGVIKEVTYNKNKVTSTLDLIELTAKRKKF